MGVTTYTNRLKKRMPWEGQENWKDERDTDDQIDDVVMGALLTDNRVISGGSVSAGAGLNADYAAKIIRIAGTIYTIAAGSIALTAAQPGQEQVNWIYVDNTGTVTSAITPPSGDYIPLALVDTSDTAIIRIADLRPIAPEVEGFVENDCINGTFANWQRGTSQTSSGNGSDDRFLNGHGGSTKTHSQQEFTPGQTDVPGNPKYFSRTVVASASGTSNFVQKIQKVLDVRKYSGKRVCVKLHGKVDAVKNIAIEGQQVFGTGGSTIVTGISAQKTALSTSWAKKVFFIDFPSVSGKTIGELSHSIIGIWFDSGSDYNSRSDSLGSQSGTFDLAEIEFYISDIELPVRRRTDQEELVLCLPYYSKSYNSNVIPGTITQMGKHLSIAHDSYYLMHQNIRFLAPMIKTPSIKFYSPNTGALGAIYNYYTSSDVIGTVADSISEKSFDHRMEALGIANHLYSFHWTAEAEL